jgi:L-alanine-DL-glutamate epimerase-like enolase superfamily enzyme
LSGIWNCYVARDQLWDKRMKITKIDVIELRMPGWTGETFDGSYDNCIILVHTDGGVIGLAEVDSVPSVIRAIVEAPRSHTHAMGLGTALIGQDPENIEALWERMYDATSYYGRRGVVIHAISAIDIALWDIRGKVRGQALAELLGGRKRSRVLPMARSIRWAKRRTRCAAQLTAVSSWACAPSRSSPIPSGATT